MLASFHPHRANYYDKELFDAVASHISANFTKYETDGLLKVGG